jgi:hypothetical protein
MAACADRGAQLYGGAYMIRADNRTSAEHEITRR